LTGNGFFDVTSVKCLSRSRSLTARPAASHIWLASCRDVVACRGGRKSWLFWILRAPFPRKCWS
jgi:hypothetical protein